MQKNEQIEYRIWVVKKIIKLLLPNSPTVTNLANYVVANESMKTRFIELMIQYYPWAKKLKEQVDEEKQRDEIIIRLKKVEQWISTLEKDGKKVLGAHQDSIDSMAKFFLEDDNPYKMFIGEKENTIFSEKLVSETKDTISYLYSPSPIKKDLMKKIETTIPLFKGDSYNIITIKTEATIFEQMNVRQMIDDIIKLGINTPSVLNFLFNYRRWDGSSEEEYAKDKQRIHNYLIKHLSSLNPLQQRHFERNITGYGIFSRLLLNDISEVEINGDLTNYQTNFVWKLWVKLVKYLKNGQFDYVQEAQQNRYNLIESEAKKNYSRIGCDYTVFISASLEDRKKELLIQTLWEEIPISIYLGHLTKCKSYWDKADEACRYLIDTKQSLGIPIGIEYYFLALISKNLNKPEKEISELLRVYTKAQNSRYIEKPISAFLIKKYYSFDI